MNIGLILSAIFLPAIITAVFSIIQVSINKTNKTMSYDHFIITLPKAVMIIGIVGDFTCVAVIVGFTFFSGKTPSIIFYIVFGLFLWLGTYLILKTLRFKVIVKNEKITVHSIYKRFVKGVSPIFKITFLKNRIGFSDVSRIYMIREAFVFMMRETELPNFQSMASGLPTHAALLKPSCNLHEGIDGYSEGYSTTFY